VFCKVAVSRAVMKLLKQARPADAGLPDDQHQLTLSLPCTLPAPHQQGDFFVTAINGARCGCPARRPAPLARTIRNKVTAPGTPLRSWPPRSSATSRPATWPWTRAVTTSELGSASVCLAAVRKKECGGDRAVWSLLYGGLSIAGDAVMLSSRHAAA
jgi:hypothetical protein